jgi:hypothetical protein
MLADAAEKIYGKAAGRWGKLSLYLSASHLLPFRLYSYI